MIGAAAPASCAYELDHEYRIVSVDPSWTAFAVENGAPELVPPAPYGRAIWSYISDLTTAQLYKEMFDKVMKRGQPLSVPIRCDSPELRRFLRLDISRRPIAGVRVQSAVLRLEAREPVVLFDPSLPRLNEMVQMCSWCKRVAVHDRWEEVEEATAALRLFERHRLPEITHAMCPECRHAIDLLLDDR